MTCGRVVTWLWVLLVEFGVIALLTGALVLGQTWKCDRLMASGVSEERLAFECGPGHHASRSWS